LIMFIDWSGSMANCMNNTIAQMLNLVLFCRQVNIPFEVYSFTDGSSSGSIVNTAADEVAILGDTVICELFSNKMRAPEFNKMVQYMCTLVDAGRYCYRYFTNYLSMGSTPLNETIVLSKKMFEAFKKNNRLDIVNMVFLTDGDSNRISVTEPYADGGVASLTTCGVRYSKENVVKYIDKETKKQYRVSSYGTASVEETRILLSMLRENTGANVIGFRIFSNTTNELTRMMYNLGVTDVLKHKEMRVKMSKDKYVEIPGAGYSKFFGLHNRDLEISENVLQVSQDAAKSELRRAFGKMNKNRLISRVFLNKFIELVA
jgi:hypothetical protein